MNKDFPYVHDFIDARGNRRYVFRRKGFKSVTIKGRYKSAEFHRHYGELLAQAEFKTIGRGQGRCRQRRCRGTRMAEKRCLYRRVGERNPERMAADHRAFRRPRNAWRPALWSQTRSPP